MPDELWRARLGPDRAVYVETPHRAILIDAGGNTGDVIQLRAILAAPYLPPNGPGQTLFIAVMTDRGSERERGRIGGILMPNGSISRFGSPTMTSAADWTMKPPFAHSMLEKAVLGRAGGFLRLVLAYNFFGPERAREAIAATPPARLRAGKPRKDESLFAITRLHAAAEVGRPKSTMTSSWSLTSRQEVKGHFKLQAYGPQLSLRRMIWIDAYQRGPEGAPLLLIGRPGRKLGQTEQLLRWKSLGPEEFAACLRLAKDYELGPIGSFSSPLSGLGCGRGSSAGGNISVSRLARTREYEEAAAAVQPALRSSYWLQ